MKQINARSRFRAAVRAISLAVSAALLTAVPSLTATAQGPGADLEVHKTAPDVPYGANTEIQFTITVSSNGPSAAPNARLEDVVPNGLIFTRMETPPGWLSTTPAPGGTGTIVSTTPSLAPEGTATFLIVMRTRPDLLTGVRVTNTATVSSQVPDPFPANNSSSFSFLTAGGSRDSAGVYDPTTAAWFLRNMNTPGAADLVFTYGPGGLARPIKGDYNSDGIDTVGVYDPATAAFFLKNFNTNGPADIVFTFGAAGSGQVPLVGDWNGDGVDTIGLYEPTTGNFFLRNTNSSGPADIVFSFGPAASSLVPIVGDWNGNGVDTIGLYNPATGTFFLKNTNSAGAADLAFNFGPAGSIPLAGDWDGDGFSTDSIGVYVPSTASWFLRNTNTAGNADITFVYGPANLTPLGGDWNGI